MTTSNQWFIWALLSAIFAVFAVIFLGERPSVKDWLGIVMVAGGVLILAFKR